jgi:hypothetical protein
MSTGYDVIDEALQILTSYGPDLQNGMTSHAPMAVEALCALGRPAAVMPWLERYRSGMLPAPAQRTAITPSNWRDALMHADRTADWKAFFAAELKQAPWATVLDEWVNRLAPGICASAAHGVIRVGHAVRSLAQAETALRRSELAEALGYWAANYQELPTRDAQRNGSLSPSEAILQVPVVPPERRVFHGSIVSSLIGLNDFAEFAPVIELIDSGGDLSKLVQQMGETFTHVYLANAHDFLTSIVFVHGVTSVAALGHIAPYVSEATARRAARYAWQASCALYSAFGRPSGSGFPVEGEPHDRDALIDSAVRHGDEHVIKFTEACLALDAAQPAPAFSAAVRSAMTLLPAP